MSIWQKKDIAPEVVKDIHKRYSCDLLTASIFARRGVADSEYLYYLEEDPRYLHNPYLFNAMEDVVDRIFDAKDEGEKVLIFGDRDVDGITSTVMLHQCLKDDLGIDVQWRIPGGNESYGLNKDAIDAFASDYGSLIITVDCGISNVEEIAYAAEKGIEVIVIDHHNAPEILPDTELIINPKVANCGYPFDGLAGCGVTYKVVTALRFAKNELYKQEMCLLNVRPLNDAYTIECIKMVNMRETDRLSETVVPGTVSIQNTRLLPFLQGQQILVWDEPLQAKMLSQIFGDGVEFNLLDIRSEVATVIPAIKDSSLVRLTSLSKIAKYTGSSPSEIDTFFNLFVTFVQKKTATFSTKDMHDIQLVMLATLADLMPLKNENRILVRLGLKSLNTIKPRSGLLNLLARQKMLDKKSGSTDLSWNIIPILNAAGRLDEPQLAVKLFLEEDPQEQERLAQAIFELNEKRKKIGNEGISFVEKQSFDSFKKHDEKLIVVFDERVHRGITGLVAGKLCQQFKVPAIVITSLEDNIEVGSVRSTRGYDVTGLLAQNSDFFINHGGHAYAAGFSLKKQHLNAFLERLQNLAQYIEFAETKEETLIIDAELPHSYLNPDILKLIDRFEPYGEGNPLLQFKATNLRITAADIIGKTERQHLKLTLKGGSHQWPAMFWGGSERFKRDFDIGDTVDAVFQINRNTFNGTETAQLILADVVKTT